MLQIKKKKNNTALTFTKACVVQPASGSLWCNLPLCRCWMCGLPAGGVQVGGGRRPPAVLQLHKRPDKQTLKKKKKILVYIWMWK